MKYTDIAIKIAAAKECGIIVSNALFWKELNDINKLEEKIKNDFYYKKAFDRIRKEFDTYNKNSGIICAFDNEFPIINRNVKNNGDKPYLLFYEGDISLLEDLNKNVAVIGLRDPDDIIIEREIDIVKNLVKNNHVILSGLAKGCDSIAHKICIEESGKTIAVLPTELKKIYPKENQILSENIINKGGLLITEYYKDSKSKNESISRLIERDRLQAMFAKAVILIASYVKGEGDSGSRHAMEAADKYMIDRYIMYNEKLDENDKRFGLNKYILKNKKNKHTKILNKKNINDIKTTINIDIIKQNRDSKAQLTFEYC